MIYIMLRYYKGRTNSTNKIYFGKAEKEVKDTLIRLAVLTRFEGLELKQTAF